MLVRLHRGERGQGAIGALIVLVLTSAMMLLLVQTAITSYAVDVNGHHVIAAASSAKTGLLYAGRRVAAQDASGALAAGVTLEGIFPPTDAGVWTATKVDAGTWHVVTESTVTGITRHASTTLQGNLCPSGYDICVPAVDPGTCWPLSSSPLVSTGLLVAKSVYVNGCLDARGVQVLESVAPAHPEWPRAVRVYTSGKIVSNSGMGANSNPLKEVVSQVGCASTMAAAVTSCGPGCPGWYSGAPFPPGCTSTTFVRAMRIATTATLQFAPGYTPVAGSTHVYR